MLVYRGMINFVGGSFFKDSVSGGRVAQVVRAKKRHVMSFLLIIIKDMARV